MREYRTLDEVTIEYFTKHPEEIDDFLAEIFADYAEDGDSATLLSSLRIIARVKGVSAMATEIWNDPTRPAESAIGQWQPSPGQRQCHHARHGLPTHAATARRGFCLNCHVCENPRRRRRPLKISVTPCCPSS